MTKEEIIPAAENIFVQFSQTCGNIEEIIFFEKPGNKWSVAENMQHLILSVNTTTLAYSLPRFLVKWIGGRPNRASRTYDELLARYNKKIEEGGTASSRYVPKSIEIKYSREKILHNWKKTTSKFITSLTNNRTEKDLDAYLVKHPLLGRITLRELCYFTIFHTSHHLESIHKRFASRQ
jgi:DinB superfamily